MAIIDLTIQTKKENNATIVSLSGELDDFNAADLDTLLTKLIQDGEDHIIIDLTDIQFLDSVGLGTIVKHHKQITQNKKQLGIVCCKPQVIKLIERSGLHTGKHKLPVFESVSNALSGH